MTHIRFQSDRGTLAGTTPEPDELFELRLVNPDFAVFTDGESVLGFKWRLPVSAGSRIEISALAHLIHPIVPGGRRVFSDG